LIFLGLWGFGALGLWGFGALGIGSAQPEEEAEFIFRNRDGLTTLRFFFESVLASPSGTIRGVKKSVYEDALKKVSTLETQLTDMQLLIALDIATSLTVSLQPATFASDVQ